MIEKIKNKFLDIAAWTLTEGPNYFWMAVAVSYFVMLLGMLIFSFITNPVVTLMHSGIVLLLVVLIIVIVYLAVKISRWKDNVYSWAIRYRAEKKAKENETIKK